MQPGILCSILLSYVVISSMTSLISHLFAPINPTGKLTDASGPEISNALDGSGKFSAYKVALSC